VEVRKTEYIVRGGSFPFPLPPRRRRAGRGGRVVPWTSLTALGHLLGHPQAGLVPRWRVAGSRAVDTARWLQRALPWRRLALGGVVGALLLLVAASAWLEAAYAERIYPRVRTLGVDIGGQRREEARAALNARLAAFVQEPLVLRHAEFEWRTTPEALGWQLDVALAVEAAYRAGREGNPLARLAAPLRLLGGVQEVPQAGAVLDAARARALLAEVARALDRPVGDARLTLDPGGAVRYTAAQTGRRLDIERSLARLQSALLVEGRPEVALVVEETLPRISDAELAAAREQAETYLAGPVTLRLGDDTWTLEPKDVVPAIEWVGPPDRPQGARLNREALQRALTPLVQRINQPALNARFEFVNGELRVLRESREGRTVDQRALVEIVEQALHRREERTVLVPAQITLPAVTTQQRHQLGIRELIQRGQTRFAGSSPPKVHNIKLAAQRLHGVVVPPGAMFSFNTELGPTTLDNGYQVGWGIAATGSGGHATVPAVAGGICQVATTLFQPVFWAGYQIEERHAHLYWIPAYGAPPLGRVGLDATVDEDYGLDFRFINNSPDYLLIQAVTDDTTLYVSLYGNKPTWTVSVEGPTITNRRAPNYDVVRYPEPTLPWGQQLQVESAGEGFDVTLVRTVKDGEQVRTLTLHTRYEPSQNLVVVGVRGAPPGVAEEIRASNRPAVSSSTAAPTAPPSAGQATAAARPTTQPTAASAGVPGSGAPAATGPASASSANPTAPSAPVAAPTAPRAPAASSGASAPSAPAANEAARAPAAAPAPEPPAAPSAPRAPALGAPAAPASPAPAAPAVPRFSGS
jgi:vancomycin resistance protein YoaR